MAAISRELTLRIYSAIVMIAVVLACTWYGGLAFRLFAVGLGVLVYYEWSKMTRLQETSLRGYAFGWFAVFVTFANLLIGDAALTVPLMGGFVFTACLFSMFGNWTRWHAIGILYASLSAVSLSAIRGDDSVGFVAMLFVFAVVWSTDILAYFFGRAIGGPKLAPRISPGKTWSGAVGGTFSGVAAGMVVALSYFQVSSIWLPLMALFLSVSSQIGDLFESFIKRRFGVKDSSHLIPGHGGVMDRVDGLVFACFATFFLAIGFSAAGGTPLTSLGAFLLGR